jgi:hypothetical protein
MIGFGVALPWTYAPLPLCIRCQYLQTPSLAAFAATTVNTRLAKGFCEEISWNKTHEVDNGVVDCGQ